MSLQIKRVIRRQNLESQELETILQRQVNDLVRINKSHFVINTAKTKLQTKKQVYKIIKILNNMFDQKIYQLNSSFKLPKI